MGTKLANKNVILRPIWINIIKMIMGGSLRYIRDLQRNINSVQAFYKSLGIIRYITIFIFLQGPTKLVGFNNNIFYWKLLLACPVQRNVYNRNFANVRFRTSFMIDI